MDAKGTKGGEVVLAAQSQFTGAVTVKDGSSGGAGSATLTFSEDNALTGASSVTVNGKNRPGAGSPGGEGPSGQTAAEGSQGTPEKCSLWQEK